MKLKPNKICVAVSLIIASTTAVNANTLPREMAMGGTGVASGLINTAGHTNPALLSSKATKEVFSLAAPYFSIGVSDEDDLIDAIDDFQDSNVFENFENSIDNAQLNYTSIEGVKTSTNELNEALANLDNKKIRINALVGASVTVATETIGIALTASGMLDVSSHVSYTDKELLNDFNNELSIVQGCLGTFSASCAQQSQNLKFVDPVTGDVNFDPEQDIKSSVNVTGIALAEIGASFSTSFLVADHHVAIGATPKFVTAKTINYSMSVNDADVEDFDADEYTTTHNNFNIDVGAIVSINDKWSTGIVVKNLIKQNYDNEYNEQYNYVIKPHAQLAIAYDGGWINAAIDVDANKKFTSRGDEQIVAFGVEIDAFEIAQVRAGYRHDLEDTDNSLYSAGIGFSPFGVHFDLGVAGNEREVNASAMFGFKW